MKRTILDVLGDPESWSTYRSAAWNTPLLRGATIVSAFEVDPDELRIAIEARGQMMQSTFSIADRDVRHRVLEVLQPGRKLAECLDHAV